MKIVLYHVCNVGLGETSSDALRELRTERASGMAAVAAACNYSRHSTLQLHAHALTNTNKPPVGGWRGGDGGGGRLADKHMCIY